MSEFREEIERARKEHQEVRYPGDLGAEVLNGQSMRLGYGTKPPRHWLFWTSIGSLGAMAATVAIVMWRVQPAGVPCAEPLQAVAFQPRAAEDFSIVPELAGAKLVPSGGDVVPSEGGETAYTMPAMPSFPSMDDAMKSAGSDPKKSSNS
ncbi:MAG TPA: hypothetical protein VFE58_06400 [Tepidisphaeraceae bacterium]|jgi:hypothetical protein|nr:hypothetical protein [Tepidisphaeraceae bacterium]